MKNCLQFAIGYLSRSAGYNFCSRCKSSFSLICCVPAAVQNCEALIVPNVKAWERITGVGTLCTRRVHQQMSFESNFLRNKQAKSIHKEEALLEKLLCIDPKAKNPFTYHQWRCRGHFLSVCVPAGRWDPDQRGSLPASDQRSVEPSSPTDAAAAKDQRSAERHRDHTANQSCFLIFHQHVPLLHPGHGQVRSNELGPVHIFKKVSMLPPY